MYHHCTTPFDFVAPLAYSGSMKTHLPHTIKERFSIFADDQTLVYLDTAASALTLRDASDALCDYYAHNGANIARGVYPLAERATSAYEGARADVARFLGAQPEEVIFTSGATMSLNMAAHLFGADLTRHDAIAVTAMDHHANFVPWQQRAQAAGAAFQVIPVTADGYIDPSTLGRHITRHTRVLALPLVSNVLGTIVDVPALAAAARTINPDIVIVVDAAQAVAHMPVDVTTLGCDALAFSGHKLYGPTGIGVLYLARTHAAALPPFLTGGEMVAAVSAQTTHFKDAPHKFEAGTPHIAGAIGLGAAVRALMAIGMQNIAAHDRELVTYALTQLRRTLGNTLTLYGPQRAHDRSALLSFTVDGIHPHDLAWHLGAAHNIAIRAGQHCTMPLHDSVLHTAATARASFGLYTTRADIDALCAGIISAKESLTR